VRRAEVSFLGSDLAVGGHHTFDNNPSFCRCVGIHALCVRTIAAEDNVFGALRPDGSRIMTHKIKETP
jgi:hypothetical protein